MATNENPGFRLGRILRIMAATNFARLRPPERAVVEAGPAAAAVDVSYVGHATVLAALDGRRAIFDPVFSRRLYLTRRLVEPGIALEALPPLHLLLLTHGHHDHLDLPTLRRLPRGLPAVCSPGLGALLRRAGLRGEIVELDWWERAEVAGFAVTAIPARHWGRRGLSLAGLGYGGFVVERAGVAVYHAGDTAYGPFFRDISARFPRPIDVALLPIGGYRPPSFRFVHMDPEDALRAFADLGARYLVPIHWGTFVLSYEPPEEPPARLRELAASAGDAVAGRVHILPPGATLRLPPSSSPAA